MRRLPDQNTQAARPGRSLAEAWQKTAERAPLRAAGSGRGAYRVPAKADLARERQCRIGPLTRRGAAASQYHAEPSGIRCADDRLQHVILRCPPAVRTDQNAERHAA